MMEGVKQGGVAVYYLGKKGERERERGRERERINMDQGDVP